MNPHIGKIDELPLYENLKNTNYQKAINIFENKEKEELLELANFCGLSEMKKYLENVYQNDFYQKFEQEFNYISCLTFILNSNPNNDKIESNIKNLLNSSFDYIEAKGDYYYHLISKAIGHDEICHLTLKELVNRKEDYNIIISSVLKNPEHAQNYYQKMIDFNKDRILLFNELNKFDNPLKNTLPIKDISWVPKAEKLIRCYLEEIIKELFTPYP
jgi:hypothetical protein